MAEIELLISKDKLTVHVNVVKNSTSLQIEETDVYSLLAKHGISYGIKRDVISKMIIDIEGTSFPLLIAEGELPKNGKDGFIKFESLGREPESHSTEVINFRNVRQIPSVKVGQLIAIIYPNTPGIPGKNVFGQPIRAEDGKPFSLKLGKNVVDTHGKVYATIDGQISLSENKINILPVFEVLGDLSLKTGNIDFIGNVTINGNVPSDYIVKAGGDISINGIVEGARVEAGGSIYISGGVVGFTKASICAGGDIIASYINQCKVNAGNNIEVNGSILHSACVAKYNIICLTGSIIGGYTSAGNQVSAKVIGNESHTKTEIHIDLRNSNDEEENRIRAEIDSINAQLEKVILILQKLSEKYKRTSSLTNEEILILKRDRLTQVELTKKLEHYKIELEELVANQEKTTTNGIVATGVLYPNVYVQIGKYQRIINQLFHHAKVQLVNKEISINHIS